MDTQDSYSISHFIAAYLECAAWSSTHTFILADGSEGETVQVDSLSAEWSEDARKYADEICKQFIVSNAALLSDARISAEQAGHDLWLTAAGHGAGFWDRGLGEVGRLLTEACEDYIADIVLGDDGLLHIQ